MNAKRDEQLGDHCGGALRSVSYAYREMPRHRFAVRAARFVSVTIIAITVGGCVFPPEVTIASSIAQAAIKAGMRYAEENKPTPEQAWASEQTNRLAHSAGQGDKDAQFQLAQQLQAQKKPDAATWMCRAAQAGHAQAQRQVGHWFNEDRRREDIWPYIRLTPSDKKAYAWYVLAKSSGDTVSGVFQYQVARRSLSVEEASAIDARITRWIPGSDCTPGIAFQEIASLGQG